jgi:hypothetical protein
MKKDMKFMSKKFTIYLVINFLLLILVISAPVQAGEKLSKNVEIALDSINKFEGLDIISELASDKYAGRLTGSKGQWEAAYFIENEFKSAGLKPFGGMKGYQQNFTLATNQILPTPELEIKTSDYEYTKYEFGKNFICRGFSGSADLRAEVVFCGYGISSGDYDDYAGIDVKGKIVFAMYGSPRRANNHIPNEWDMVGKKANIAKEHGAVGMILTKCNPDGEFGRLTVSVLWGDYPHLTDFPVIAVDRFVATDILSNLKQDLPVLMGFINQSGKPASFQTGVNAHLKVDALYNPLTPVSNVVGILEGSDPRLKGEYVVIGAHMDHVGMQGANIICPGANDNASGVASLIEIAHAFKESGLKPARNIIFVAFTAEEMGLKGSQYFIDHLPFAENKIRYMINLDMVGDGNNEFNSFSKDHPEVTRLVKKANSNLYNLQVNIIPSGFGSDHASFHDAGIPCTMILNAGEYRYPYFHTHYYYREWMINTELWKQVTDTTFLTLWYMAN